MKSLVKIYLHALLIIGMATNTAFAGNSSVISMQSDDPFSASILSTADTLFTTDEETSYDLPFTRRVPALAQADDGEADPAAAMSPEELEELRKLGDALANPLSSLWLLFAQNDTAWYDGDLLDRLDEDSKVQNSLYLMPVMPFQLTQKWKVISRIVVPIHSFETVDNVDVSTNSTPPITGVDFDRETGLGDIVLWTAFSKQYKPPFIWGFGPTIMLDTASEDQLGTGRTSAGPMALVGSITDNWIVMGIFQHWWSIDDDKSINIDTDVGPVRVDRADVSLTDIQYIIRYRLSAAENVGMAPNIRYNWETDELSLPVGIGYDTIVKWGKLPIKVGAEVHYYVEQDDKFGPEWMLRMFFSPVVPSPAWSKEPILGE